MHVLTFFDCFPSKNERTRTCQGFGLVQVRVTAEICAWIVLACRCDSLSSSAMYNKLRRCSLSLKLYEKYIATYQPYSITQCICHTQSNATLLLLSQQR